MIDVRATQRGYFGGTLREPGDVFQIGSENEYSDVWMERLGRSKAPDKDLDDPDDPDDSDDPDDPDDSGEKIGVRQDRPGSWSVISFNGETVATGLKRGKAYSLAADMRKAYAAAEKTRRENE